MRWDDGDDDDVWWMESSSLLFFSVVGHTKKYIHSHSSLHTDKMYRENG